MFGRRANPLTGYHQGKRVVGVDDASLSQAALIRSAGAA
jgi:hypothetical protein